MTETLVDFPHIKRPRQHTLGLDKATRDAMADYWRMRWPSNTAKHGAREFRLTLDQGRSVVAGRASLTTIDQIEKAGGWPVIFAVKAMVIGYGADQYLAEVREHHEANAGRLAAIFGVGRSVGPDRDSGDPHRDLQLRDRRRPLVDHTAQGQG
jgi:hypothetical protein